MKDTEFVIQYSCGELMRDGTSTGRIPTDPTQCAFLIVILMLNMVDMNHADYMYCRATSRNKGMNQYILFIYYLFFIV